MVHTKTISRYKIKLFGKYIYKYIYIYIYIFINNNKKKETKRGC